MSEEVLYLNVPEITPVQYERNYIKTAVCEFRFPIMLEWEDKPPPAIFKKLRKEYPFNNKVKYVDVIPSQKSEGNIFYNLQSKNNRWTVSIKPESISLETSLYKNFEEFYEKLEKVKIIIEDQIETDFFTRVGLRYINIIPFKTEDFKELLNPDLVKPLYKEVFGTVSQYTQLVQGHIKEGMYNFRHGIKPSDGLDVEYFLDFDYFKDGVEIKEALDLIKKFHNYNFNFFCWSLGKKGIDGLGKATPK